VSLRGDIYDYLVTVTAVTDLTTAGGIHHTRASSRTARPYIVLGHVGTIDSHHLLAASGVAQTMFSVDVWADTSVSLDAVSDAVRTALNGKDRVTLGGTAVKSCRLQSEDSFEEQVQAPGTQENNWHIRHVYSIWHAVSVPTF
jgi:hypothetical protein